jgi:hypothetical protein
MKISWDFHELNDFGDNLQSLGSAFDTHIQRAAKEIAKVLLKYMKGLTPRGKTNELINGWNGNAFVVKGVTNGYEVEIVNKAEYAAWVNDGHKAYNQFGGPYPIRKRVKVTSPHQWQKGSPKYYVFGHFFVERGIVQLNNTQEIELIIMGELQKWWRKI